MDAEREKIEELREIRSLMERSSRFISLSGLSGVFAGIFALIGAWLAADYLQQGLFENQLTHSGDHLQRDGILSPGEKDIYTFFIADALLVLIASLAAALFFTTRRVRKQGGALWNSTSRRLLINLMIPLATGGIFCLALLYYGSIGFIAPAMLVFYGLALINAGKYTLDDVRYLGIAEIAAGLLASFFIGYGLIFWSIGFGALHIVYGVLMYYKYERKEESRGEA